MYVLPVGFWGLRALWPRPLRHATTGAIALGLLSLVGMGLSGLSRVKAKTPRPPKGDRWKLPFHRMHDMPEEFAASAASGY
jgi:hypothetical protein